MPKRVLSSKRASKMTFDYDLIVLGNALGGLSCAKEAASVGARVAVVEAAKPLTDVPILDTCNFGPIAKRLMHQAAFAGEGIRDGAVCGWKTGKRGPIKFNWSKLVQSANSVLQSSNRDPKTKLRDSRVDYISGVGSFAELYTILVKLDDNVQRTITGRYIVIAVGERAHIPIIPGSKEYGISSDQILCLERDPGKSLIVGGGFVGFECASFLKAFGYEATIMVRAMTLRGFDREMASVLTEIMSEHGVTFIYHAYPTAITKTEEGRLLVKYTRPDNEVQKEGSEVCDTVIFATGRANIAEDLQLENVSVHIKENKIPVNLASQTNVESIYAVGDNMFGGPTVASVAIQAGRLLARRLFAGSNQLMSFTDVATNILTPLEYAYAGMVEEDAIHRYGEDKIEVYRSYYKPLEFLITSKNTRHCYIKAIALRKEDQRVIGIHFVGPYAGEVVQGFAAAMKAGLTMEILKSTHGIYPTNAQELTRLYVTKRSGGDPNPYKKSFEDLN